MTGAEISALVTRANAYAAKAQPHLDEEALRNPRGDVAPLLTEDSDESALLDWLAVIDPHTDYDFDDENDTDSLWSAIAEVIE